MHLDICILVYTLHSSFGIPQLAEAIYLVQEMLCGVSLSLQTSYLFAMKKTHLVAELCHMHNVESS